MRRVANCYNLFTLLYFYFLLNGRNKQQQLPVSAVRRHCELLQEREAVHEREQKQLQMEKEKEVARLRSLQEKARDEQAERDAIRARRAQEQAEREWRRREAEEVT